MANSSFITILVLLGVASHRSTSLASRMAHDRLISPLPILMQLFGPTRGMSLPEGSEARRRLEELDDNRLSIGPLETTDGYMFTIYKASSFEEGLDTEQAADHVSLKTWTSPWRRTMPPFPKSPQSLVSKSQLSPGYLGCRPNDGGIGRSISMKTFLPTSPKFDFTHGHGRYQSEFSSRSTLVEHLTSSGV